MRIRQELARRGLEPDVIAESTAGLEETDLTAALALWRRRFGQPAADAAGRERQLRFLRNRGFAHGVALQVLRIAARDDSAAGA
jgi:regulatory protein